MKVIIVLAFCFVLSLEFINAMDKEFSWKHFIKGIIYGCLMVGFIYLVGDVF